MHDCKIRDWRVVYLYVLKGWPVQVNNYLVPAFGVAKVVEEIRLHVKADKGRNRCRTPPCECFV
ncbi:MAG: hypothetical protein ACK41Q_11090 [Candidatus Brocadia sp.]